MVVTEKVDPWRRKSTVNGENRMLIEVVDPEPLTGDHVLSCKETERHEFMEGERDVAVRKGKQGQANEMLYGGRDSVGESVTAIGKGKQCQSIEAFPGGRKSTRDSVVIIEKGNSASHRKSSQRKENRQGLRSLLFEVLCQSM
jgi:hypothetical protein